MIALRRTVLLALLFLGSGGTFALTIGDYQGGKNGSRGIRELTVAYVSGIGAAYTWANLELKQERQPLLFCQPPTLALGADLLAQLLDKELQNPLYRSEDQIEMALLFALKRAFPCQ